MIKNIKNLHDKKEYVTHIRNLNPALNHEIVLTKVYSANKLNHQSWLKPYIDTNTELRKNAKADSNNVWFSVWLHETKTWQKRGVILNTDCSIVYTKREDIYEDLANDIATIFDTSNYQTDHNLK